MLSSVFMFFYIFFSAAHRFFVWIRGKILNGGGGSPDHRLSIQGRFFPHPIFISATPCTRAVLSAGGDSDSAGIRRPPQHSQGGGVRQVCGPQQSLSAFVYVNVHNNSSQIGINLFSYILFLIRLLSPLCGLLTFARVLTLLALD